MEAIQCSATQVRIEPHSEVAKRNAVYYRKQEGVTRKDFVPREVRTLSIAFLSAVMAASVC